TLAEVSPDDLAPRLHGARAAKAERVARPDAHRRPVRFGADLHRCRSCGGAAVAQLPPRVVTPGPQGAVGSNGCGAELAGADDAVRLRAHPRGDGAVGRSIAQLARR